MFDLRYLWAFLTVVLAYLLGSINFAILFSKLFVRKDVRDFGSGNAGMTNVMRVAGVLPGLCTFVCDALKGFAACAIAKIVFTQLAAGQIASIDPAAGLLVPLHPAHGACLCGLACMLGHMYPIFFSFRGGKGVAVSVGIFAVCCPLAIALGLAAFGLVLLCTRIVSLSSLVATVVVVTLASVWSSHAPGASPVVQIVFIVAMGALVFFKHRENIGRLLRGEEKKLKSRKSGDDRG